LQFLAGMASQQHTHSQIEEMILQVNETKKKFEKKNIIRFILGKKIYEQQTNIKTKHIKIGTQNKQQTNNTI